jgi:effector-binding domain-containing protein
MTQHKFEPTRRSILLGSVMTTAGFGLNSAAFAQPATPPAPTPPPPGTEPVPPALEKPSADASTGQIIDVQPRPVLRVRGQSLWDDGFAELRKAIALLEGEAKRLGLAATGQPFAHFIESDDLGFTYEAMLPLAASPPSGASLAPGLAGDVSPFGRAAIFQHEGPYDEIDAAYEAITAFLDEKGLTATGRFMEEYLNLPEKSDDPAMRITITIFLR